VRPTGSKPDQNRIKIRAFENGNLHLWFLDQDLLDGVNRVIAEHYGAALGRDAA